MPSPSLHLSYRPVRMLHQPAILTGPNIDCCPKSGNMLSPSHPDYRRFKDEEKETDNSEPCSPYSPWSSSAHSSPLSHLPPQLSLNLSIHSSPLPVCCVRENLS